MIRPTPKLPLVTSVVLLALSLGAPRARAAAVDLPLDAYLCYQAAEAKFPAQTKLKSLGLSLSTKDPFELAAFRNWDVSKFSSVCNPLLPAPIAGDSAVHLVEVALKESKSAPNAFKFVPPPQLYNLADRLGMLSGVLVRKPKSLLVRSSKLDWGPIQKCAIDADCASLALSPQCDPTAKVCRPASIAPPSAPGAPLNTADFVCYGVSAPRASLPNVTPSDQFGYAETFQLKKITKVCAPASIGALNPGALDGAGFAGSLICYQAKSTKTNPAKFLARRVAVNNRLTPFTLDAKKQTEICMPALRAIAPTVPAYGTPTTLTATSSATGGACGSLAVNLPGEGVPNRLNPATGVNGNADCTGAGAPSPCCTGTGAGHCDERTTITCGSLSIGGGGPAPTLPGPEIAQSGGQKRRFALACSGPQDTACAISGHPGDLPHGINCSTAGCGFLSPLDTTTPLKVCGLIRLAAPSSGSLDLVSGTMSLTVSANIAVNALTITSTADACPRCRATTATSSLPVFSTGPDSPGVGVCDGDSANPGATCYVFEPAGSSQGLSSDCTPVAALPTINLPINIPASTAGSSIADPAGHFCPGQAGNADCLAAGVPNPCCSGVGAGTCSNFDGCFGSANTTGAKFADTPATCTGISVQGQQAGLLVTGADPVTGSVGGMSCVGAVNAGAFTSQINGSFGLPSPVVVSAKNGLEVN